jgi:hypothetical protein
MRTTLLWLARRRTQLRPMLAVSAVLVMALAGCAVQAPQRGAARAEVQARWGPPTASYSMPDGQTRLEYASGPYGRTTWMVDVDAAGSVVQARQVLNEAEFLALQTRLADGGMPREDLLRWLGRPGERRHGGRPGGEVWSWRYPTNDCLWFEVSVTDAGLVHSGAYAIDPRCDSPADGRQ